MQRATKCPAKRVLPCIRQHSRQELSVLSPSVKRIHRVKLHAYPSFMLNSPPLESRVQTTHTQSVQTQTPPSAYANLHCAVGAQTTPHHRVVSTQLSHRPNRQTNRRPTARHQTAYSSHTSSNRQSAMDIYSSHAAAQFSSWCSASSLGAPRARAMYYSSECVRFPLSVHTRARARAVFPIEVAHANMRDHQPLNGRLARSVRN